MLFLSFPIFDFARRAATVLYIQNIFVGCKRGFAIAR
jgi:hypothetical protein